MGIYMALSASGLILFKLGASNKVILSISQGIFNFKIGYLSIFGILCYGCSFIIYLGLVSKYNLSYLVPVTSGIIQILILLASYYIFDEVVTVPNVIGVIFVVIGVCLINFK